MASATLGQTKMASTTLGQTTGYAQPVPTDVPDLQRINGDLQHQLGILASHNEMLSDLVARIYGGGEPTTKDGNRLQAAGIMGSLTRQAEEFAAMNVCTRQFLDRLASLA